MLRSRLLNLVAVAAVAAAAGCDDGPARRPTRANDELWKLAPAGARGAIVASPYAIGALEDGTLALRELIKKAGPELAALQDQLDAWLGPLGGRDAKLADLGLTRAQGGAVFFGDGGKLALVVVPIADRDRFLAKAHGTRGAGGAPDTIGSGAFCKRFGKHYACAQREADLATVGKGDLAKVFTRGRVRGDIEAIFDVPLGGARSTILAAVTLERGELVVRGILANPPKAMLDGLSEPTRPRTPIGRTAGFGVVDLRPRFADAGPQPVAPGVTLDQVVKTLDGPLLISVPAGAATLELTQPLSDPKPVTAVVAACAESPLLAPLGAKRIGDKCLITLAQGTLTLDVRVEGNTLRLGKQGPPVAGKAVAMSPAALEMATGKWGFVLWGRGTSFASNGQPPIAHPPEIDPRMLVGLRAMAAIDEAGFAVKAVKGPAGDALRFLFVVRTVFANPPDVVAALTEISARDVVTNTASQRARPIAEAHRGSPFAADYAAGQHGLLLATYLLDTTTRLIAPIIMAASADDDTPTEAPVEAPTEAIEPPPADPMPPEEPAPPAPPPAP